MPADPTQVPAAGTPLAQGALGDRQREILDALRADGIAVVRYEQLLESPSLDELWEDAAPFVRAAEERSRHLGPAPRKKAEYIVRRYVTKKDDGTKHRFTLDDPFIRAGASSEVLGIVNAYRGLATKVTDCDVWYTVPFPAAHQRVASQRWHRDPEEEHVVKAFLYLTDVDEDAGPFEYVKGSPPGGRYGDVWPWSRDHRYPPDEELQAAVASDDVVTVTGEAGTLILCDTSGFHRGGFARSKPRVLGLWNYVSPGAKEGRRFEVDLAGREVDLAPSIRVALG